MKRLFSLLWWSTVLVVVGLAVMLSAARLLLPGMSAYRAQIETVASNFVSHPVRIGSLDAAWRGLAPVLKLQQVEIENQAFPGGTLAVREVHLRLNLLQSLLQQQWRTSELRVIGTSLAFSSATGNTGGRRGVDPLSWLLQQQSIVLEDVSLDWSDDRWFGDTLQLRDTSLRLFNRGGRHHLALASRLAQDPEQEIRLMADLTGPGHDPRAWSGQLYLRTRGVPLELAAGLFERLGLSAAGRVDLECWAGIARGRPDWSSGNLVLQQGRVATDRSAAGFDVERLDTGFRWQSGDAGWQLDLHDFAYSRDRQSVWPAADLSLVLQPGESRRLRGRASHVVIDELNGLLPLLPWVDADARAMVERLQPAGQLRNAEFALEFPPAAPPRFSGRALFERLAVTASAGLPGMSGLSGRIEGNLQSGSLQLDSGAASLRMPALFSTDLELTRLVGTVHWQRYAETFRLHSETLAVSSAALDATVRLQLDWPSRATAPWIDLQAAAAGVALDQVHHYLPDQVMSPRAIAWLREAFDSGTAHNLRFVLQGPVDQIPFDTRQGRLEGRFDFEDLLLDYHPQWGQLRDARGSALFQGRSMRISATAGRIHDSPVRQVVASIEDLVKPVLEIDGAVEGAVSGMLDYLTTTPLEKRFGGAIRAFDSSGDAHVLLALRVPLKKGLGQTRVRGSVALQGNGLAQQRSKIGFTDIKGQLSFTDRGISAKKLTARFLGKPVVASIYRQGADADGETVVDVQGRPDLVALLRARQPALAEYFDGEASWRALLKIPVHENAADAAVQLQLQSDLVGIGVSLPAPLTKAVSESRNLLVSWAPDLRATQPLLLSYGTLVDARAQPNRDWSALEKADVRFGSGTAQLPEQPEIRIGGQLEQLDLDAWLDLWRRLSAARVGPPPAPSSPVTAHLALMNFFAFGHQVKDLRIDSESEDAWQFSLQGEGADGRLRWTPAAAGVPASLHLALEHLQLKRREPAGSAGDGYELSHPAALPQLDISIAALRYADRPLGRLRLSGKPVADGFVFDTLGIQSDAIKLSGEGSWRERDGRQYSHLEADIRDGELEALGRLFADNSAVRGGRLSGRLNFNWRGGPAAFAVGALEGELLLKARDGQLVHVDEGAGKLLNLISLNSLQRRLSLDFSDITREGFSFDTLEGRFILADGDAFTNDFRIEGSSAIINVSGRTGLVARDYDQLVTVTPQVSSGLPIAGAIAGGPAVGAAVFLAEKLVGQEFNRITELQYQVSGSWDKPVYKRLQRNP